MRDLEGTAGVGEISRDAPAPGPGTREHFFLVLLGPVLTS